MMERFRREKFLHIDLTLVMKARPAPVARLCACPNPLWAVAPHIECEVPSQKPFASNRLVYTTHEHYLQEAL